MLKVPKMTYEEYASKSDAELGLGEIVYWGQEHDETLHNSDIHDKIEQYLDDCHLRKVSEVGLFSVVGYERMSVKGQVDADWILEAALERLNEEHGDPDGHWAKPTEKMKEAAKAFAKVVEEEYVPWCCEPAVEVVVDPLEWAKEHRPDWLEEEDDAK